MNQNIISLLNSISILAKILGTLLAAHGAGDSGLAFWLQIIAGSSVVVGSAVWDIWEKIQAIRMAKAIGVQAGVNLTVAGKALAADGVSVVGVNNGTTPPKAVTIATAAQIVADFGPTSVAKQ